MIFVNISFSGKGQEGAVEQENLTPFPTEVGSVLAKAPKPAGSRPVQLPILFLSLCPKPGLLRGETQDQVSYKDVLALPPLPLTEALFFSK